MNKILQNLVAVAITFLLLCTVSVGKVNAQCGGISATTNQIDSSADISTLWINCPQITMAYLKYQYYTPFGPGPVLSVPAGCILVGQTSGQASLFTANPVKVKLSCLSDPNDFKFFFFFFDYATTLGCQSDQAFASYQSTPLALHLLDLHYAGDQKMKISMEYDQPEDVSSLWLEVADESMWFKKETELIPQSKNQTAYVKKNGLYRLCSTSADGENTYSKTVQVNDLEFMDYLIEQYGDRITCRATAQCGSSLFDITGQQVRYVPSGANICIVGLPPGLYIYRPNMKKAQPQKILIN